MIIYKEFNSIGSITISSGKGNLFGRDDISSLLNIVETTKNDEAVRGLLIGGDKRCFSTGLAVDGLSAGEACDLFGLFDKMLLALFSYPKPVVVVVDGHSIGGGLLLQCCGDYVVAANNDKIKFGLPELKIGLSLDELMVSLLKFNVGGVRLLQELLYAGDYVGVRRSKELGFIDSIVQNDQLIDVGIAELTKFINYKKAAFGITKLRLRAHTIQRMTAALNSKCYMIFNELK